MRTEITIKFKNELRRAKKNPSVIFAPTYFYPRDLLLEQPVRESRMHSTVLEKTGDKKLADFIESWARFAAIGQKYEDGTLTAEVCCW